MTIRLHPTGQEGVYQVEVEGTMFPIHKGTPEKYLKEFFGVPLGDVDGILRLYSQRGMRNFCGWYVKSEKDAEAFGQYLLDLEDIIEEFYFELSFKVNAANVALKEVARFQGSPFQGIRFKKPQLKKLRRHGIVVINS